MKRLVSILLKIKPQKIHISDPQLNAPVGNGISKRAVLLALADGRQERGKR